MGYHLKGLILRKKYMFPLVISEGGLVQEKYINLVSQHNKYVNMLGCFESDSHLALVTMLFIFYL